MRLGQICFMAVLSCDIWSPTLRAQQPTTELRIKLNPIDNAPISGALVALLDFRDSVVAEGLGSENGVRLLRAPPGEYRVRVRRIGYLPFVSSPIALPRSGTLALDVLSPRVQLDQIVVTSSSQCRPGDPDTEALSIIWGEIDKALQASQLTMEDLEGIGRARKYRLEVGANGNVVSADTTVFRIIDHRPFGAIAPESLATTGYVQGDERKGWVSFGPDEMVLRSDEFAATHCFKAVRDSARPRDIGVAFEPIPDRLVPEIAGVIWVDRSTAELREIVFNFVNAGVLSRFEAGGFTRFRHVPSGAWIVDEWKLHMPRIEAQAGSGYLTGVRYRAIGYVEHGGGIISAESTNPNDRK
jgi:hypothetical protein